MMMVFVVASDALRNIARIVAMPTERLGAGFLSSKIPPPQRLMSKQGKVMRCLKGKISNVYVGRSLFKNARLTPVMQSILDLSHLPLIHTVHQVHLSAEWLARGG